MSSEYSKLDKTCQNNLASYYDQKIQTLLKPFDNGIDEDRKAIHKFKTRLEFIKLTTKTLPVVTAVISIALFFLTQQILTALINLVNSLPPFFQDSTQKKIEYHQGRRSIRTQLDDTRIDIKAYVQAEGFKGNLLTETHSHLDNLKSAINTAFDLNYKLRKLPTLVRHLCRT